MHSIYNAAIGVYGWTIRCAALFHSKARLWVNGRRGWKHHLVEWRKRNPGDVIWMHCASLGEFEQGRPLVEAIRRNTPSKLIVITFFSPSGFEIRKNYPGANLVMYLPQDSPSNVAFFLSALRPSQALFVKYEYWANYFFGCKKANIPLYIISGVLRPDQRFFGWASSFWRKVLGCVSHFFVQDQQTFDLLGSLDLHNATISGDTRFDRVLEISERPTRMKEIEEFKSGKLCLVVGSSWREEEDAVRTWLESHARSGDGEVKIIIAPHDISDTVVENLAGIFSKSVRWSERDQVNLISARVIIMDTMGMLSSLYAYADVAFIGGGFGKGIHNILEPAVYGVPVIFGPAYSAFNEAVELVKLGGAYAIQDRQHFPETFHQLLVNAEERKNAGRIALDFVRAHRGATERILSSPDFV